MAVFVVCDRWFLKGLLQTELSVQLATRGPPEARHPGRGQLCSRRPHHKAKDSVIAPTISALSRGGGTPPRSTARKPTQPARVSTSSKASKPLILRSATPHRCSSFISIRYRPAQPPWQGSAPMSGVIMHAQVVRIRKGKSADSVNINGMD